MSALVKSPTEGDVVKFDLEGNYTREVVTLLAGTDYKIGSVLGTITASGKYTLSPEGETQDIEGAEDVSGVLIEAVDASEEDAPGVIIKRGPAIVAEDALVYDASVDDDPKKAAKRNALVALGIVSRVSA